MDRILIVDDDPASATELRLILEKQGFEVNVEFDSPRAVQTALTFKPTVIFIDYMMPKAHGGDVAWQICAEPIFSATRIILYSRFTQEEIRLKLPPREIPILEKPVTVETIRELLPARQNSQCLS